MKFHKMQLTVPKKCAIIIKNVTFCLLFYATSTMLQQNRKELNMATETKESQEKKNFASRFFGEFKEFIAKGNVLDMGSRCCCR